MWCDVSSDMKISKFERILRDSTVQIDKTKHRISGCLEMKKLSIQKYLHFFLKKKDQ